MLSEEFMPTKRRGDDGTNWIDFVFGWRASHNTISGLGFFVRWCQHRIHHDNSLVIDANWSIHSWAVLIQMLCKKIPSANGIFSGDGCLRLFYRVDDDA